MQRFISFDLETTGVDPTTAQIVTWALAIINADGTVESCETGIVNPGIEIPEEASNVHGITTERARTEGGAPADAILRILSIFASNPGVPIVIYNARYDLTVLIHEQRRWIMVDEMQKHYDMLFQGLIVIDPLVIDKQLDKYRPGRRTLEVTCNHYGVALEDAHTADADAIAAGLLMLKLAEAHPTRFRDFQVLHRTQVRWAAEQARSLEHYFRYKAPKPDPAAVVEPRWPFLQDLA